MVLMSERLVTRPGHKLKYRKEKRLQVLTQHFLNKDRALNQGSGIFSVPYGMANGEDYNYDLPNLGLPN